MKNGVFFRRFFVCLPDGNSSNQAVILVVFCVGFSISAGVGFVAVNCHGFPRGNCGFYVL